ncbi:MAG: ATP-grasp domain-containing protein [bacterium]
MEIIKDLDSQRKFFRNNLKNPVLGVGVYAFNRLGLENIIPDYRLLCLRYSLDTELIEQEIELLSLEKGMGTQHIKEPRNSTTILQHPKTINYLRELTNKYKEPPVIVAYKASTKMEQICQENLWTLAVSSTKFGKTLFENKIKFRRMLEELYVNIPTGEILNVVDLDYNILSEKYSLPFVIQHPTRGGGKGTFFVNNIEDFDQAIYRLKNKPNDEGEYVAEKEVTDVIVMKFIKGSSPSITGCVTKHGILSTSLQYQILDIPELYNSTKGSGLFCGHDWSSSNFSDKINQQAYEAVKVVGKHFQKWGYKGIFGLDFVLDEKNDELYTIEANPRMLGSFPTLAMSQTINCEPSIMGFHLLEYLNLDYKIDIERVNTLMRQPKKGTHMFLHNLSHSWARNHAVLTPGIYKLNNDKLQYLRRGYKLQHLRNEDEFLITEGVPMLKAHFSPNRRLCRILTLAPVLEKHNKLNLWAKKVAHATYKEFKIRPVFLPSIRKIFNPDFLAKG